MHQTSFVHKSTVVFLLLFVGFAIKDLIMTGFRTLYYDQIAILALFIIAIFLLAHDFSFGWIIILFSSAWMLLNPFKEAFLSEGYIFRYLDTTYPILMQDYIIYIIGFSMIALVGLFMFFMQMLKARNIGLELAMGSLIILYALFVESHIIFALLSKGTITATMFVDLSIVLISYIFLFTVGYILNKNTHENTMM